MEHYEWRDPIPYDIDFIVVTYAYFNLEFLAMRRSK
jgi:hypothetical protein